MKTFHLYFLRNTLQAEIQVIRKVTKTEWDAGVKGFISHAENDPDRRTDPGANFDWVLFMKMIQNHME